MAARAAQTAVVSPSPRPERRPGADGPRPPARSAALTGATRRAAARRRGGHGPAALTRRLPVGRQADARIADALPARRGLRGLRGPRERRPRAPARGARRPAAADRVPRPDRLGDRLDIDDVAGDLVDKLVRRHPHVFAGASADDLEGSWEALKAAEKGRVSVTEGIPLGQPALTLAAKLQRRAAESASRRCPTTDSAASSGPGRPLPGRGPRPRGRAARRRPALPRPVAPSLDGTRRPGSGGPHWPTRDRRHRRPAAGAALALKPGPATTRVYDPLRCSRWRRWRSPARVRRAAGCRALPRRPPRGPPETRNRKLDNSLSLLPTTAYPALQSRYGDHLVTGIAGESVLLELTVPGRRGPAPETEESHCC